MKTFYLFLALVTFKIITDGNEYVCHEAADGKSFVCTVADNDACYDPVTKRWEPCY